MNGSTSTQVFCPIVTTGFPSPFKPGSESKRTVPEGLHELAEAAMQFQSWSVASAVSSKTPMSTFSAWFPFFVVTFIESFSIAISVRGIRSLQVFLPPLLLTQTNTLACNASAPPSMKDFRVIRPGSCLPSRYPNGVLHKVPLSLCSWTRK